mmetsp:Transcript_98839/g.282580  ORF Transcript_98839/g.282580 Transcript_98839/m.282580 type:complete len:261 (-) Transcript_98839:653-1435(-)
MSHLQHQQPMASQHPQMQRQHHAQANRQSAQSMYSVYTGQNGGAAPTLTTDEIGVLSDLHRRSYESSSRIAAARELLLEACSRFHLANRPGVPEAPPGTRSAKLGRGFASTEQMHRICAGVPVTSGSARLIAALGDDSEEADADGNWPSSPPTPSPLLVSLGGLGAGGLLGDKVEELLLSNIREWSFVEAQVLEPTVRVHAPEILVPLQHLTSSLEMLGHYYVMRDQLASGEVRLRGEPELDRTELDPELKLYSNRIESR